MPDLVDPLAALGRFVNVFPNLVAATAFAVVAVSMTTEAAAKDKTGAVVGGLIAGAAIGAAISSASKHPTAVYVGEKPKPKPDKWTDSFSPKPGVRCYPVQHACYGSDGAYSASWKTAVLVRFGTTYGLFLAEGNDEEDDFCESAKELKADSEIPNVWQ